jgi:hypothetical protein
MSNSYDSSSTLPEIQERQIRIQYRYDWLQALLGETLRELKLLLKVEELTEEYDPELAISDGEILKFVNQISNILLDFEQHGNTPQEIQQREQQLQYYRACFQYLLDGTVRELGILSEIVKESLALPDL